MTRSEALEQKRREEAMTTLATVIGGMLFGLIIGLGLII